MFDSFEQNKIMIGALVLLVVLSIGYALFSDSVEIQGSATAKGDFQITSSCNAGLSAFLEEANTNGTEVIIAAAGMAAALPGVVASQTVLPVIGVPISGSTLDGMDALLSIVQMPPGIPVATVAINGGKNAAHLALQIMAVKHEEVKEKLWAAREEMEAAAMKTNEEIIQKYQ